MKKLFTRLRRALFPTDAERREAGRAFARQWLAEGRNRNSLAMFADCAFDTDPFDQGISDVLSEIHPPQPHQPQEQ